MTSPTNTRLLITLDGKQAEKMLTILTNKSDKLKEEIRDLNKKRIDIGLTGNEAKRFDTLKKELRETRKAARETARQVADVSSTLNRLSSAPIQEIKRAITAVTAQMSKLDRNTDRYAQRQKQLTLLKAELDRINGSGEKTASTFDGINKTIKRLASYVVVYMGFNLLKDGLRKLYDMNVALSDQLSDIEKTTNITGESLHELSDDINRIDTRTSVEELNKLAAVAGKIGVQGKKDVLEFVKAGNIINVALGEDLGEDAIKNIAKLNDVLGVTKELGVERSLLATGSAINELGQNSTANEGYLVDFAQRLGGIAAQSGLTIQQVLALGSVTDQLGQNVEVSATALNKVITTIVSDSGQVAKAIGVTKEELQGMLDKSTWDALLFVLEKLAGKGGLAAIAPLMGDLGSDGARLTQVISALTSNTEKLYREIGISNRAFSEATSVVKEYEKKNNNLAATIEKIGKNIKYWFLDSKLVDWLNHVAIRIERLTRAGNSAYDNFKKQDTVVKNLTSNISPLLDKIDALKDPKSKEEQEALSEALQQVANTIPGAVTWMDKYGNALGINTERAREFIKAQQVILKTDNAKAIKEAEEELYKLRGEQIKQLERMEEVSGKGSFTTSSTIGGGMFGGQTIFYEEKDQKKIQEESDKLIYLNAKIDETKKRIKELSGENLSDLLKGTDQTKSTVENALIQSDKERKKALEDAQKRIDIWLQKKKNALTESYMESQKNEEQERISQEEFNKAMEALEMEALNKKLAIIGLEPAAQEQIKGQILSIRQKMMEDIVKIQKEVENILLDADPIKKEEKEYEERLRALGIFGKKKEELTKEQLDALRLLETDHNDKLTDIERKLRRDQERRAELRYTQKFDEEKFKREMEINEEQMTIDRQIQMGGNLEGDLFDKQMQLHLKKMSLLEDEKKMREDVGASTEDVMKRMADVENDMFSLEAERFKRNTDIYKQYASQMGEAFGQILSGQQNALESFGDATIDILFDILEKIINAKLVELAATSVTTVGKATAESMATPDSVLTFGAAGAARAAVLTGLITAAIAAAKAGLKGLLHGGSEERTPANVTGKRVVKGYVSGGFVPAEGYTGNGGTYEVAGVVHGGEYVIPKRLMRNRMVFNYARVIETLRERTKWQGPMSPNGFAGGGGVRTEVPPISMQSDPQLVGVMGAMLTLLKKLDNNGVQAYTTLNVSNITKLQNKLETSRARGSRKH